MTRVARIVVEIAVNREFDYSIPAFLASDVAPGSKVLVPFGRAKRIGYVVGLADTTSRTDLKEIISVEGDGPLISPSMLRLCRWVADYYCCPIEYAVRTVLPGAVRRTSKGFRERLFVKMCDTTPDDALEDMLRRAPRQAAVLSLLTTVDGMFMTELISTSGATSGTIRALAKKGLVTIGPKTTMRDPAAHHKILHTRPLDLMAEQAVALNTCVKSIRDLDPGVLLLFGVTGSGKTEVYLQGIQQVLDMGRGAIVLVPEISLTPQAVERFRGRFGDQVAVLHSHLSEGERHDEWYRIRDGGARIAVGARSAVFAPVKDLGLIVVDEEHDTSYKQAESPRYNARDVAVMRGVIEKCAVVLGSATPSMESYTNVCSGKYGMATLSHRVDHRRMPSMRIVDMRVETEREGRVNIFSRDLVEAIRSRLSKAEQTMLFLNRRGYATSLVCPRCGHVARCDSCSVAFTYHRHSDDLKCHICGATRRMPGKCQGCGDPAFKFAGMGTQRVENVVRKLFPTAAVQRMDSDVTTRKNAHRDILDDFRVGKTDILIGTQMIAKGLDFPNVTLIGVVYADLSLHIADFRAGERTFQLLTQVAGRAGRGEVPGEVIVQTYTPFHAAIQAARRLDYVGFYDQELEFRKELKYPPCSRLVCVTLRGRVESRVEYAAQTLAARLAQRLSPATVLSGPAPAPLARAKGYYRYQLMVRSTAVRKMVGVVRAALEDLKLPPKVTCSVDVDALNLS